MKMSMNNFVAAIALMAIGSFATVARASPTALIGQSCLTSAMLAKPPHMREVRRLLADLPRANKQRQAEIFRELEALGNEGVPAMVAQMNDRHELADQAITLENKFPGAFEGRRFYGPELVVDAMDAILNQITADGGSIVNGGSEQQRQAAVRGWRKYVAELRCR